MHVRLHTYTTGTRVSDENLSQNQYESFEVEIFLEQQKATNFHMTKKYKKKICDYIDFSNTYKLDKKIY